MKYFFLIQIAISLLLASSLFLSHDSNPSQATLFSDKITTIQSSREKLIQTLKDKTLISKLKKKSRQYFSKKNKSKNDPYTSSQSQLETIIIDNGLDPELLSIWLPHKQLSAIHYRRAGQKTLVLKNFKFTGSGEQARILQLSSQDAIDEVKEERGQKSNKNGNSDDGDDENDKAFQKLSSKSFQVISFIPGKQDNGEPIEGPRSYAFSLRGPDHYYDAIDPTDTDELKKLRERTISLGHGGEIILQVTEDGAVLNRKGADFVIFENPLILSPDLTYQEFAYVGVAEENKPDAYKWFPCNPQKSVLIGCAGVVPASDGGDLFDLSIVGMDQIKYIKIKDIGTNLSNYGKNTEGFDLDSLKLIYPFKKLPPAETESEEADEE